MATRLTKSPPFHGGKVPIQTVLAEDFTLQMAETAKALDDGQSFQSLR
jgi:hypothetical protein